MVPLPVWGSANTAEVLSPFLLHHTLGHITKLELSKVNHIFGWPEPYRYPAGTVHASAKPIIVSITRIYTVLANPKSDALSRPQVMLPSMVDVHVYPWV